MERFFRDGNGNCTKHVLPEDYDAAIDDGPGYSYRYDEADRLTEVTGPDGTRLAWYAYDLHGNMTAEGKADGSVSYYWYDLSGNLLEKAEPVPGGDSKELFCRTSYTYDGDGRQTGICFDGGRWTLVGEGDERRLEEAEPGKALRLSCSFDARGRLIQVTDGTGACARYAYDVRGNRIREEQTISEGIIKTIHSHYDRAGRLSEKRELIAGWDGEGAKRTIQEAVTTYKRDANGNIIQIRTPEGYQIFRGYDLRDRLVCERMVDEKNGIDRSTLVSYDRAGNVVSLRRKGADGRETEIACQYDLKDRLVRARSMEGAVFGYSYDLNDRLVEEERPSAGHAQGTGTWNYRYDRMGRLTERRGPEGQLEEWDQYDAMGRRTVQRLADGEEAHLHYGAQGLLSGVSSARSREEGLEEHLCYDREGRQILSIDRLGNRVETEYDIDGNPVRRVSCDKYGKDCDVRVWKYDCVGYLKEAVGGGSRYRYEYRPDGKLLSKEVPGHATLHLPSGWQRGDHDRWQRPGIVLWV